MNVLLLLGEFGLKMNEHLDVSIATCGGCHAQSIRRHRYGSQLLASSIKNRGIFETSKGKAIHLHCKAS